ncbi:MAG: 60S ribosomal export protein NMD3 [Halodesulfurarchaeum sp.]
MSEASGRFCPRCGEPIDGPWADSREQPLCEECFLEDFELVDAPDSLSVTVCGRCGAVQRGEQWVDVGARDYTDVAVEAVTEALAVHREATDVSWTVDPEQVDQNTIRMHATFTAEIRDRPITEEHVVPVTVGRGTCTRCGRIAGDYYASVLQIRADGRDPTDEEMDRAVDLARSVTAEMEAEGDRNAFVTDITEVRGGLDVKLSTNQIGRSVAYSLKEEFGGTVRDSETLVTEDEDGEGVYRVTFVVRLPRFRPGDIVDLEDGESPVLVQSVHGNLKGTRLATGDRYEAPYEAGDTPEGTKLGTRDDGVETTVVVVEDEHAIQVLDPETAAATTIPRPDYVDPDSETVTVFKSEQGLFALPEA